MRPFGTLGSAHDGRVKLRALIPEPVLFVFRLVQFLKAMRDENGQVREDAHLIGLLNRIWYVTFGGAVIAPGEFTHVVDAFSDLTARE
jgi:hypothetical protein